MHFHHRGSVTWGMGWNPPLPQRRTGFRWKLFFRKAPSLSMSHHGSLIPAVASKRIFFWEYELQLPVQSRRQVVLSHTHRSWSTGATGQLLQSQSPQTNHISEYSYDQSGNILSKDGNSYINQGWQLSSITDSEGNLLRSFDYSPDGHLTKEKDGLGQDVRTITYDSLGWLTRLNSPRHSFMTSKVAWLKPLLTTALWPIIPRSYRGMSVLFVVGT